MAGFYVRDKYLFYRSQSGKWAERENSIPGRVHYVVPTTAYDSSFTVAMAGDWARRHNQYVYDTVNLAYADTQDGRGDAIVLLPGTHTLTANLAVSKSGVSFWGAESWMGSSAQKPSSIVVPLAATDGFTVTGEDVSFNGLTIVPITQKIGIAGSVAANRLRVLGCFINMAVATAHTSTKGIVATGAASDWLIKGNTFHSLGAHGPFIDVTALLNYAVKDNDFIVTTGATMAVGVLVGAAAQGLMQRNSFFGGTLTAAISGTGATGTGACRLFDNNFGVLCTVPIDNFSAVGLTDLKDNRLATVGGGSGGTLITANT